MFTNEYNFDETVTTILDEEDFFEDLQLVVGDDCVHFRQWNERMQCYDIVVFSHDMFNDLITAIDEGEGMFKIEKEKKK